ncbi:hypothetical protein GWO43_13705 [candidate division KSB1 bacterium]|nr:hypothetical protein [candidate division KSB1 bacterium]NIR71995.1 hypothetical protein [candidate division KSB1 bacterium]NIS24988.1 hypothetical protein [candidate division KSB1 bacterium]NIT71904.1 hypothetical protein [candidate division KSB1 bacterium]NIU25643.1 hypothetical protein [candidate division KSB1 bacterium]
MTDALLRRFISLSRFHLMLFAFSFVALIHKFDSRELEKDIRAPDQILLVNQIDVDAAVEGDQLAVQAKHGLNTINHP